MSSPPTPQPPRRRRIAGERRPATPAPAAPDASAPPADETAPVAPTQPTQPHEPTQPPGQTGQSGPTTPVEPEERLAPDTQPDDQEPAGGGWWGSRASLVVLTVTLLAALTLTGLGLAGMLGNRGLPEIREAEQVQEAEETAPSVAERAAAAILAYDHRSLEADQDAAQRFMTPAFAEKYADSFTKAVAPAARTYKAQVTAEVLGSSVVRATPERVRVLVFVNQTTVATNKENPQEALNRVEFDLVLRGGSWLVDNITSY